MDVQFGHLDQQLSRFSSKLRDDLHIDQASANRVASVMHTDCIAMGIDAIRSALRDDLIPLHARKEELVAFQLWMEWASSAQQHPAITRAQVITELYFPFVYLRDTMFDAIRRVAPSGTTLKRICKCLCDGEVRALRNAVAHGNWTYCDDFSGIRFWAAKGQDQNDLELFEMKQTDLDFWQSVARCTAYVVIEFACAES